MTTLLPSPITCSDNSLAVLRDTAFIGARLTAYQSGRVMSQRDVTRLNLEDEIEALAESCDASLILIDAIERYEPVEMTAFATAFNNTNRGV